MPEPLGQILLVDDDDAITSLGRLILERAGYGVVTARSGREAIDRFREADPPVDVVILDHRIPDMTGLEILAGIRNERANAAVIVSSGCEVPGLPADDPGVGLLPKPYAPGDLVTAVAAALPRPNRRTG